MDWLPHRRPSRQCRRNRFIQCDEIWTLCRKKRGHCRGREINDPTIGDQHLYTAMDTSTKLLVSFTVGKLSAAVTNEFIADLEKRLVHPPVTSVSGRRFRQTAGDRTGLRSRTTFAGACDAAS
jgi:hypothetical protein